MKKTHISVGSFKKIEKRTKTIIKKIDFLVGRGKNFF